jgi:hypothetical protein
MNTDNRKAAILILVAVLALLAGGTAWVMHGGSLSSSDRGEVIATVDGDPIYLRDAAARLEGLMTAHSGGTQSLGTEWKDRVLQSLVDDVLIRQEADRQGITVADQQMADQILSLQGMFATLGEYESWLASQGIDQDELERRVRLQLLATAVYDSVTSGITVPPTDVRAYYREHRGDYAGQDGTVAPYADVRATIQQQLENKAKDAAYAAWQDERRAVADVVMIDEDWWRRISDEQQG